MTRNPEMTQATLDALQNVHTTKCTFADLAIGDTFDFVNMVQPHFNSFYRRCVKISARKYQAIEEPKTVYAIGRTLARVYHVAECKYPAWVETTWKPYSYDVWGNARDGFEVNDRYGHSEIALVIRVEVNNPGTPQEFVSAYPSDSQIREALGLRRFKLELDGDDLSIYVNRARDGYPCGELLCTSHASLSPIRVKGCCDGVNFHSSDCYKVR